jgi:hypothetical protein
VLPKDTNCRSQVFMFHSSIYILFALNSACKRDCLLMMIFVNVCSTWIMVELNTRFETWITRNDVNGVILFHLSYLITLMAYLRSQSTPIVQIKYFTFDWSIYRILLLNRGCKRNTLTKDWFSYCFFVMKHSWNNTRFEASITRNDVNSVSCFTFLN